MTPPLHTEEPPRDGLVPQLARDDVERKKFLKMAGRTVGSGAAASALAAFIAACGSSSSSSSSASSAAGAASSSSTSAAAPATTSTSSSAMGQSSGDLAIVNYALTLEYLEAEFYDRVVASGLFHGPTLSVLKSFQGDEHEHVTALKAAASSLGTPAMKPTGKFPLKDAASVAKLAATVENIGAAAYLGQAPHIKDKKVLAAALAIHSIEARHAATLAATLKLSPTPDGAFAKPMSMAEVLAAVKPFMA